MRRSLLLVVGVALLGALVLSSVAVARNITGTNGSDFLVGTHHKDAISGGPGGDRILAKRKGDRVDGGSGNDVILGQRGQDKLYADNGAHDRLRGDGADDFLNARDNGGGDVLRGGADIDRCVGDPGDTFIGCEVII